jgi:hypothetical protein
MSDVPSVTIVCPDASSAIAVWAAAAAAPRGFTSPDGRHTGAIFPQAIAAHVRGMATDESSWGERLPAPYALLAIGEAACLADEDDIGPVGPGLGDFAYGGGASQVRIVPAQLGRFFTGYQAVVISGPHTSSFARRVEAALQMFHLLRLPNQTFGDAYAIGVANVPSCDGAADASEILAALRLERGLSLAAERQAPVDSVSAAWGLEG